MDKSAAIYMRLAKDANGVSERLDILGELARNYEKAGMTSKKDSIVSEIKKTVAANKK